MHLKASAVCKRCMMAGNPGRSGVTCGQGCGGGGGGGEEVVPVSVTETNSE